MAKHEMKRALLLVVLLAAFAAGAFAHEVRPAYLELRQTGPETYDVLWKVPGPGRELAPRTLRGVSGGLHERHPAARLRWSTTPSPSAGP